MKLEELTKGARVRGLAVEGIATVKSVEFHGQNALEVIFADAKGALQNRILTREDEPSLEVVESERPWSFDADGSLFRLVSEARRIQLAWLFDPYVAITSSTVIPLPHQISAVYEEMLPRQPMRFLLADDPGAGKTIMAGLLIKEMMIRGDLERCLIISPGSLTEQWQDELRDKFGLEFELLTRDMGTAPGADNKNPGIDDRKVRLGCVQPGESVATFGDALRRITDRAKYIHQDQNRYWVSTKANLNRLAEDRASTHLREAETLYAEIVARVQRDAKKRGDFTAVHACPEGSEVVDEPTARLVVLHPKQPHKKGAVKADNASAAVAAAKALLESKGTGPRLERNCLLFLAPDMKDLDALLNAVAQFLAWKSIERDSTPLNLDKFQESQAEGKVKEFDSTVDLRLQGTYAWGIAPRQNDPASEIEWEEFKVGGEGSLGERASARFTTEWVLRSKLPGVELRTNLDKYLWTERDHVSVAQLAEWFSRYLYLPRVTSRQVIELAVQDGASVMNADDTFAIAGLFDEAKKRYSGLKVGEGLPGVIDRTTLVVKPSVARAQRERERHPSGPPRHGSGEMGKVDAPLSQRPGSAANVPKLPPNLFNGSVRLDGERVVKETGRVVMEVLEHLSVLPGVEVNVTLELRVSIPDGVKEDVVRTVSENAKTLKFQTFSFERE